MIDPAVSAGLGRIASRERDVLHAFDPGFVPEERDVARPGAIVANADPLGVAVPEGTFVVTPGPAGTLRYSRDGAFALADGALSANDGAPILGFAVGDRTTLVPLRVDPYDAAQGRVSDARVEADGTFAYARATIDPRTGERRVENVAVGRVALARFPAGTQPARIDARHVAAPAGVRPRYGVPGEAGFAHVIARARDLGSVDIVVGLEKLREAYVAFEALRAANRARGGVEKITLDLLK